jgi:hypothetical protein
MGSLASTLLEMTRGTLIVSVEGHPAARSTGPKAHHGSVAVTSDRPSALREEKHPVVIPTRMFE